MNSESTLDIAARYIAKSRMASMSTTIELHCREADIKIPSQDELLTIEYDGRLFLDCKLAEPPRSVSPGIVALVISIPSPSLVPLVPARIAPDTHDEWRGLNEEG